MWSNTKCCTGICQGQTENHENPSIWISGVRAKVFTQGLSKELGYLNQYED
jgi:hypothetical protein